MDKYKQDIDDIFKDRLFDHEIPAPADVWGKIDSSMKQKRNRVWFISIGAMAASIALIISAGLGYYMGSQKSEKIAKVSPKIENTQSINNKEITNTINKEQNSITTSGNKEINANTDNSTIAQTSVLANNQFHYKSNATDEETKAVKSSAKAFSKNENSTNGTEVSLATTIQASSKVDESTVTTENINSENATSISNTNIAALARKEIILNSNTNKQLVIDQKNIDYMFGYDFANEMANNEEDKSFPSYNWEMGGNVAPIYAYRNISQNSTGVSSSYFDNSEKPLITYAGGMNVQLAKGRWRIESGVYLSNMGQKIDNIYEVELASINDPLLNNRGEEDIKATIPEPKTVASAGINSNGNVILNSAGTISNQNIVYNGMKEYTQNELPNNIQNAEKTSAEQRFRYLELPFIAHYRIIDNFVNLSFSGGLSANFLISNDVYVTQNNKNNNVGTTNDVEKTNFAGIAGLSFEVPIVSRVVFRFEPRIRYYINSMANSQLISTHPYSLGIYSGISYKF